MSTQRRKKENRSETYRSDDYGQRGNYRRNNSTNSLTSFLIMAIFFAGFLLVFLLFLTLKKSSSNANVPNGSNGGYEQTVQESSQTSAPVVEKVKSIPPAPSAPDSKVEATSKLNNKTSNVVKDLVDDNDKESKKQDVVINVLGDGANKPDPASLTVKKEAAPAIKKADDKKIDDDSPQMPKSFMGGLSNPDMEEASKASREERRKKKAEELE